MKVGDLIISGSAYNCNSNQLARVTGETPTQFIAYCLNDAGEKMSNGRIRINKGTEREIGERIKSWSVADRPLEEYLKANRECRDANREHREQEAREEQALIEKAKETLQGPYCYGVTRLPDGLQSLTFTDSRGYPVTFVWKTEKSRKWVSEIDTEREKDVVSLDVAIFTKPGRAIGFGGLRGKNDEQGPDELSVLVRLAMPFLEETK